MGNLGCRRRSEILLASYSSSLARTHRAALFVVASVMGVVASWTLTTTSCPTPSKALEPYRISAVGFLLRSTEKGVSKNVGFLF